MYEIIMYFMGIFFSLNKLGYFSNITSTYYMEMK